MIMNIAISISVEIVEAAYSLYSIFSDMQFHFKTFWNIKFSLALPAEWIILSNYKCAFQQRFSFIVYLLSNSLSELYIFPLSICVCFFNYDFSQSLEHWFIWPLLLVRKSAPGSELPCATAVRNFSLLAAASLSCPSINNLDSYFFFFFFFCSKYFLPNGKHIWVLPAVLPLPQARLQSKLFFQLERFICFNMMQVTAKHSASSRPAHKCPCHGHKNKPKSQ